MNYEHPLSQKIASPLECTIQRSFAVWSDLLGFGQNFIDANWNPDPKIWRDQAERAASAYRIQCANIHVSLGESYMLLLNDGMIRSLMWKKHNQLIELGLWIKAAMFAHKRIYDSERNKGLPGPRTIISSGWTAEHSFDEVRIDDLVFNYTRSEPGLSKIAQQTGNPILVMNPIHLQLNTAFSRAFLLDEAGSKHGLSGASVYLEQAFIDAVIEECNFRADVKVNNWLRDNDRVFSVEFLSKEYAPIEQDEVPTLELWMKRQAEIDKKIKKGEDPFPSRRQLWSFGFLLEKECIEVDMKHLKTKVYKVQGFFPNDEDPADFMIELVNNK